MDHLKSKSFERFQEWLVQMQKLLDPFVADLADEGYILDYSLESLKVFEGWMLEVHSSVESMTEYDNLYILDICARYVGETISRLTGANWSILLDDKDNVYYQLPVIELDHLECPHTLVTACCHRRKGDYIYNIVASFLEQENLKSQ